MVWYQSLCLQYDHQYDHQFRSSILDYDHRCFTCGFYLYFSHRFLISVCFCQYYFCIHDNILVYGILSMVFFVWCLSILFLSVVFMVFLFMVFCGVCVAFEPYFLISAFHISVFLISVFLISFFWSVFFLSLVFLSVIFLSVFFLSVFSYQWFSYQWFLISCFSSAFSFVIFYVLLSFLRYFSLKI